MDLIEKMDRWKILATPLVDDYLVEQPGEEFIASTEAMIYECTKRGLDAIPFVRFLRRVRALHSTLQLDEAANWSPPLRLGPRPTREELEETLRDALDAWDRLFAQAIEESRIAREQADSRDREREDLFLRAFLEMRAFDESSRQSAENVTARALPVADSSLAKRVLSRLRKKGLIASKKGRGGGSWLTDAGQSAIDAS